jgi:hypothetical protein
LPFFFLKIRGTHRGLLDPALHHIKWFWVHEDSVFLAQETRDTKVILAADHFFKIYDRWDFDMDLPSVTQIVHSHPVLALKYQEIARLPMSYPSDWLIWDQAIVFADEKIYVSHFSPLIPLVSLLSSDGNYPPAQLSIFSHQRPRFSLLPRSVPILVTSRWLILIYIGSEKRVEFHCKKKVNVTLRHTIHFPSAIKSFAGDNRLIVILCHPGTLYFINAGGKIIQKRHHFHWALHIGLSSDFLIIMGRNKFQHWKLFINKQRNTEVNRS